MEFSQQYSYFIQIASLWNVEKKNLELYNILGMEKKHISRVVLCETVIISLVSLIFGILVGILFDKLMLLILLSMFTVKVPLDFIYHHNH